MELIVATEARFNLNREGHVVSENGTRGYPFWKRYLSVFTNITVIGRLSKRESTGMVVEGDGVIFRALPDYTGPLQYLKEAATLKLKIREVLRPGTVVLLRVPGTIGNLVWNEAHRIGLPYGVEVVGNPYDVFAPGGVKSLLRPFLRYHFTKFLKSQCKSAVAVSYVTRRTLQELYPTKGFSVGVSDVELPDEAVVTHPREYRKTDQFRLITVGSLAQLYKGTDVLIEAMAHCVNKGLDLELIVIGDGKYRKWLEEKAEFLGISPRVYFLGQLPSGSSVREELSKADLFVLPSRTEGLPRAILEAMAQGLPCISTNVGGIPELLEPEVLVRPGDVAGLAGKIQEMISQIELLTSQSKRNWQEVQSYRNEYLQNKREKFLQALYGLSSKKTNNFKEL